MGDVLLRGLPDDEVTELKAAAARAGRSLQSYLRDEVVHAHIVHLRRLQALADTEARLVGRTAVARSARDAALDGAADEREHIT